MLAEDISFSRRGPAWLAPGGRSGLYLADALEFMGSLPDASVDCVWTDPPYFLSNGGPSGTGGRRVSVDKGEWDRSCGVDGDHRFNLAWLGECLRVLRPSGSIWVTGTFHVYLSVGMAMMQLGFRVLNDVVWEKPNPPPNLGCRCFTHSSETLLWAAPTRRGRGGGHVFNYLEMKAESGGKPMESVWRFSPAGRSEKTFGAHPCQKPVALIARCLRASTRPGDLVLDPFAGLGSSGVAAMGLGRDFLGCDSDPGYVRMASDRLAASPPPSLPPFLPSSPPPSPSPSPPLFLPS